MRESSDDKHPSGLDEEEHNVWNKVLDLCFSLHQTSVAGPLYRD